jgi:glycosyltransferase involved in cell wall biosynthesis
MRIAIDARHLSDTYSGIAKYSENLLTHLSQIDVENEYFVFIHDSFNRRLKVGENFLVIPSRIPPLSVRTLAAFGRHVTRTNCDFLHSLSPVAPLYGVERFILTIHDLQPFSPHEEESARRPIQTRVASVFHRATFSHSARAATWLVSVSQATKSRLSDLFPETEHKTIVVHSGVEQVFFSPPDGTVAQMVAKNLQLPARYVLYIGTARPNKNVPAMIHAFGRCRKEHADGLGDVQFLLVVGRDRFAGDCLRAIRSQGLQECVRLVGPITEEEKRVLYARAQALFSVTRGEGFGFPIVEAQASGLPVLAGRDASVPEVTGESAVLVDPGDEDAIATGLAEILLDDPLRAELRAAGLENVKRFSWDQAARKVLDIYDLLM